MQVNTTAIIVDDEVASIHNIHNVCSLLHIDIVDSTTDPVLSCELIQIHQPDLLFLDVRMPEMDGIEVLSVVSDLDWQGKVIMVTAHNDYMLEAFRNNAFDFIEKPVAVNELRMVLDRIKNRKHYKLQNNKREELSNLFKNKIKIRTTYENYYINPADVFFCEADGKYTIVHKTDGESLMTSVNLGNMEDVLPASEFCRINKSFIVNCNYLVKSDRRSKTCLLSAGAMEKELHFSKTYTKHLESFF